MSKPNLMVWLRRILVQLLTRSMLASARTHGKLALMGNVQCNLLQEGPPEAIRRPISIDELNLEIDASIGRSARYAIGK